MERTTCSSCALCALCRQASLYTAQPHPHCFLKHKEGAGAGSTSSSAVSFSGYERYGNVEQRRHLQPRSIGDRRDGISNRRSTRKLDRRLQVSGTRTGVRVAESCAKRPTASRWWTRRSLKWCRLGKFSLQVAMVLWTPFRTRLTKKHLFQNRKFAQSGLREVLTLQSSLSAKAAVGLPCSVCESRGNLHLVLKVMSREEISMPAKR